MTTNLEKKSPDGDQANRDSVKIEQQSSPQVESKHANDNGQANFNDNVADLVPKFEIFEHGKHPSRPKAEAFIEDFLYPGQFSLLYGPSSIGKSIFSIDMLVRASLGLSWAGRQTKPIDVLWLPTENPVEFQHRLNACLSVHSSLSKGEEKHWFTEAQFQLANDQTASKMELIAEHLNSKKRGIQQVVQIDTLSQAIPGLDENAASVMTQVVYNVRRLLSMCPDVHVMLVHHSGKHKERGARGHSSLTAAADTEIAMFGKTIHVTKQRSGPKDAKVMFALKEIEYADSNGEVHSSVGIDYS
ncbi:helicase RepA family protein [bacterium]|nr:helicase RepA family protein [bacterium]